MNVQPLQLDYTPPGDRCIYCDADAYECEHYEEELQRERDEAHANDL